MAAPLSPADALAVELTGVARVVEVGAGLVGVRVVVDVAVGADAAAWVAGVVAAGCAIATPPAIIKAAPAATSKRTFMWLSWVATAACGAPRSHASVAAPPTRPMTCDLQICQFVASL